MTTKECWCCGGTGVVEERPADVNEALTKAADASEEVRRITRMFNDGTATKRQLRAAIQRDNEAAQAYTKIAAHHRRLNEGAPYPKHAEAYGAEDWDHRWQVTQ